MLGSGFGAIAPKHWLLGAAVVLAGLAGYVVGSTPPAVAAGHPRSVSSENGSARAPAKVASTRGLEPGGLLTIPATTIRRQPHAMDLLSATQVAELVIRAPEQLGCASIGKPNRGKLLNGIRLEPSVGVYVVEGASSYGTEETIRSIEAAVRVVLERYPDSPSLPIGDISRKGGGYLKPHRSHQSGLDVDVAYYYRDGSPWYTLATEDNLDLARTWTLLKAFVARGNVQYVFMDRSIQRWLRQYAETTGEPSELLETLFEAPSKADTIVRHRHRHRSHFHVRFHDPAAEEAGRRLLPHLNRLKR
ncbi:MAG TPA: penicillin-insensitive murein endopeptidase [Polyangiaceae bacterium]